MAAQVLQTLANKQTNPLGSPRGSPGTVMIPKYLMNKTKQHTLLGISSDIFKVQAARLRIRPPQVV